MIHLLQRTAPQVVERPLTTEDQDRRVGSPSIGNPGHAIGDAGASSEDRHPHLPRIQTGPGVSGVDRSLLVTHINHLDALVQAAVVDAHDVPTGEGEHTLHPGGLQSSGRKPATVHRRIGCRIHLSLQW